MSADQRLPRSIRRFVRKPLVALLAVVAMLVPVVLTPQYAGAASKWIFRGEIPSGGYYPECAKLSASLAQTTVTAQTLSYYTDTGVATNCNVPFSTRPEYWLYATSWIFSFTTGTICKSTTLYSTGAGTVQASTTSGLCGSNVSYNAKGGYWWVAWGTYRTQTIGF
jgi:hypothetical protein